MRVVVDSNFLGRDYFLASARVATFLEVLNVLNAELVMTTLVRDELAANYRRDIEDCIRRMGGARGELVRRLHIDDTPEVALDVDAAVRAHSDELHKRLGIAPESVVDFKDEYLRDVIPRAIERIPPCSEDGEEIRDAVLWCIIKDLIRSDSGSPVVFISGDKTAFADDAGALNKVLQTELEEEGLSLEYHRSIDAFTKHYAAPQALVADGVLGAAVSADTVFEFCKPIVLDILAQQLGSRGRSLGRVHTLSGLLELHEHFDHQVGDSTVRSEVIFQGTARVTYSSSASYAHVPSWSRLGMGTTGTSALTWTASGEGPGVTPPAAPTLPAMPYAAREWADYQDSYRGYVTPDQMGFTSVSVRATVEAVVENGKVTRWELSSCSVDPFLGL